MYPPIRVLLLCTENSAHYQMAEGLLRILGGADFEVFGAGTLPRGFYPPVVQIMAEHHIDISRHMSQNIDEFFVKMFDFIITICDRVQDQCPIFPGDTVKIHWSYSDPAAVKGTGEERLKAFRYVERELKEQLRA